MAKKPKKKKEFHMPATGGKIPDVFGYYPSRMSTPNPPLTPDERARIEQLRAWYGEGADVTAGGMHSMPSEQDIGDYMSGVPTTHSDATSLGYRMSPGNSFFQSPGSIPDPTHADKFIRPISPVSRFTPGVMTGPSSYHLEAGTTEYERRKRLADELKAVEIRRSMNLETGSDDPFVRAKLRADMVRREMERERHRNPHESPMISPSARNFIGRGR